MKQAPNQSPVSVTRARIFSASGFALLAFSLATGCAGRVKRTVAPSPKPERVVWVENFTALGAVRALTLEWVSVSGGKESLDLDEKTAVLFRGGATQALALGEGEFVALAGRLAALGRFAEYPDRRERLSAYLTARGEDGEKRFKIDVNGPIRPIYAELKALRDRVLEHGR